MIYKAYFDRDGKSIEGWFTLQVTDPVTKQTTKLIDRVPARSGQYKYTLTDWVTGKSPIPWGKHKLSTKSQPLQMPPVGTRFYPIGSHIGGITIYGPTGHSRTAIGLHRENQYPGSAGCVVIVNKADAEKTFDILDSLYPAGIKSIDIEVL